MNIIITMAGKGSRFYNDGIKLPKHEIVYKGKTLFEWSLESLKHFFENEFIFITNKNRGDIKKIEKLCDKLGIIKRRFHILDEDTPGQASTVSEVIKSMEECGFLVYNIDTHIKNLPIVPKETQHQYDGWLVSFEAEGDHWSFVLENEDEEIEKIEEKIRISNLATVGLYAFKSSSEFLRILDENFDEIILKYGETYIAPIYQIMINEGKKIKNIKVKAENVVPMGKPEELDVIENGYNWRGEN